MSYRSILHYFQSHLGDLLDHVSFFPILFWSPLQSYSSAFTVLPSFQFLLDPLISIFHCRYLEKYFERWSNYLLSHNLQYWHRQVIHRFIQDYFMSFHFGLSKLLTDLISCYSFVFFCSSVYPYPFIESLT